MAQTPFCTFPILTDRAAAKRQPPSRVHGRFRVASTHAKQNIAAWPETRAIYNTGETEATQNLLKNSRDV